MQTPVVSRWLLAVSILTAGVAIAADKKAETPKNAPEVPVVVIENMTLHIEQQLERRGEAAYLDTQLSDVVNDLALRYNVDVALDTDAIQSEGKGPETTVSLLAKDVSLASVLNRTLKPHGLTWTVVDEGILITTREGAAKNLVTTVYGVADLAGEDGAVEYDELSNMITQSVDPESWRENGGADGAIAKVAAKKSLVITQSYTNHRKIAGILKQLSEK